MKAIRKLKQSNLLVKSTSKSFLNSIQSMKHKLDGLFIGSSYDRNPALIDTNIAYYTEMRQFQAYLTKNAYDMSFMNEYDLWPHTNFGTIDNPLIIFGAGTTWRMVMCSGQGSEEESSSHEKMMFIVREGPIHRCLFCGQCFKLLKLKDEVASLENMYYSSVFTQIGEHNVADMEDLPIFTYWYTFNDPRNFQSNIKPLDRVYVFVNNDESDRLMCDPAFRLQFLKQSETDVNRKLLVTAEIERQAKLAGLQSKIKIEKDVFETWVKIEKDILMFDRMFNRYEKFNNRYFFDPDNHDRRERRMLQRQNERLKENYTFYFGGLTEQEQMYRDYYESDIEEFPDDNVYNNSHDSRQIASSSDFDMSKYDFVEENTNYEVRSPADSHIEKLLFKHRYREISDPQFLRRQNRVHQRALERAEKRDKSVVKDLGDALEEIYVRKGHFQNVSGKENELLPFASYVADEGFAQFKDYNQTDIENGTINGDILEDLNERDRLYFTECYYNEINKAALHNK